MAKQIKLNKTEQALILQLDFDRSSVTKEKVTNPYSGDSCELEPQGVALYDYIKGCEAMELYSKMQVALTLFRKLYPDEYYTLLD
jgi:hypothetical protein